MHRLVRAPSALSAALGLVVALTPMTTGSSSPPAQAAQPVSTAAASVFAPSFAGRDGLVTNEFAHWNPGARSARTSRDWVVTSGTLMRRGGTGWTGQPDDRTPDARSSNGTNSAVFRLLTRRRDFADTSVGVSLLTRRLVSTRSTPAVAWDGVHIFLRYQHGARLYYASVNRRDGHVVLKKKCPGGSSNGGTYHTLADVGGHRIPFGVWQRVGASVRTNRDGSVDLQVTRAGHTVATARDRGVGCRPITSSGATGLRGDNTDFRFRDFVAAPR